MIATAWLRWMSGDVSGVVREGAQRKGEFVGILAFLDEFENEITAANIVHQIAEFLVAEWVVAHVLNDCAAVCVSMASRI